MLDDIDLPGLDDLLEIIEGLGDLLFGDSSTIDLTEPAFEVFGGNSGGADLADPTVFWSGLEGTPADTSTFVHEAGALSYQNPFFTNGGESHDDYMARMSVTTGIDLPY